jgi:Cohesin domain
MKGLKSKVGLGGLAALAAALVGAVLLVGTAFAATGGIDISDGSAQVGDSGEVTLSSTDVSDPGLGAWTIDIVYDTSVISAVDCTPEQGGVCNPNYADDTVRITGASATGLNGSTQLGTVEFECGDAAGDSDLTISIFTFADATLGDPTTIEDPDISDGVFSCTEEAPAPTPAGVPSAGTGFAGGSTSYAWMVALLAIIGTGALGVTAVRMRR